MRNFNIIAAAALLALAQFGCSDDSVTITQHDPDAGKTDVVCVAPGWTVIGWDSNGGTPIARREVPVTPRVYATSRHRLIAEAGADPRCSQPEALDAGE